MRLSERITNIRARLQYIEYLEVYQEVSVGEEYVNYLKRMYSDGEDAFRKAVCCHVDSLLDGNIMRDLYETK